MFFSFLYSLFLYFLVFHECFFRCIYVVYLLLIEHRKNHESGLLNAFHCFLQRKVLTSLYRILKNHFNQTADCNEDFIKEISLA